ncbi:hypothetical protein ENSA5_11070 [Enhygromyxa salina]|uniref:DUF2169 domain-containing protein n=1 Tax=Enhygromyxa salina TaxID=215803 RepID=A0A2S9YG34_9BACT|nr:DUF2169 domain-containing protein [Enhygromyxa salina]PRQ04059.1 hypothetical protein ENSA5_11070 [Enhygromyxa salina]
MSTEASQKTMLFDGPGREQRLAVFIKLTHVLPSHGPMRRAEGDLPLTLDTVSEGPNEQFGVGCTVQETDLWELKPWTDVVVRGHVRSPAGRPIQTMNAGVVVGRRQKWIRVLGDRRVLHRGGRLQFSEPEPFTALELSWRRAYGGIDLSLPHAPVEDMLDLFRLFSPEQHPGAYPRNPAGRGWVLNNIPSMVDGMALPNFESPSHLLSPSRLIIGDRRRWAQAPIPAGFGWWRQGWFPRSTLLGLAHPEFAGAAHELPEVRGGWVDAEQVESPRPDPRFQSGASPGLRFAELGEDARIELHGFSDQGSIATCLPALRPEVLVAFEGRRLEHRLHLATVELLPDEGLANLVWVGHARPPVRLPIAMPRPGQRDYDLLAGVDVLVEGRRVPTETVSLAQPSDGSSVAGVV